MKQLEVEWEGVSFRQQGTAVEAPTFLMTGTRLGSKGAELGGSIQDSSHVFIRLGPCVGRRWRVGGLGTMLGTCGREMQPDMEGV